MKRIFRAAIVLVPVTLLLIGIGLWRHRTFKIMNAEPERVSKATPLQPNALPANSGTPEVKSVTREENADVEIEADVAAQRVDETISPEKTDNPDSPVGDAILGEMSEQLTLSPEAAASLKEYEAAQSEYFAATDGLKAALKARPLDWDHIGSAHDNYKRAAQHRMDALQNLAIYSDEALQKFVDTVLRQNETNRIIAERTREPSPGSMKLLEFFETISPEERKFIVEALPQIKEIMKDMYDYEIQE